MKSAYEGCLAYELRKRGHQVEVQKALRVWYDGVKIDVGYRLDLLVSDLAEAQQEETRPADELQRASYERGDSADGEQVVNRE